MIFDVEADGLLDEATKLHVMAYTHKGDVYYTHDYDEMRNILLSADTLIGHNIILYDIPVVERILGIKIEARLIDTLALSWYLQPTRNIHGLDAYGKEVGIEKPPIKDWHNLTPEEYAHRCVEDVKINKRVWKKQKEKLLALYGTKKKADRLMNYLMFKMDCAREQERSGWKLDVELAQNTYDSLLLEQEQKVAQLQAVMPKVIKTVKKTRPKKPYKKDGTYSAIGAKWFSLLREHNLPEDFDGEVEVFSHEEEPNPNSSEQIKSWLFSLGWEPITFDYKKEDDGSERAIPQVRVDNGDGKELCSSVLELAEKEPDIKLLEGLTVIQHRLGIFKGFLKNQHEGWLKAEVAGFTNTLRFKHRVIVNLPGVDKAYGDKIRGALIAPEGCVLCGSDAVSLEETTKKHYMWDYDPDFVTEMSRDGFDAHLDLAKFAGAVTQEEIDKYVELDKRDPDENPLSKEEAAYYKRIKAVRKVYKAANYACIYGVGAAKLARTVGISLKEAKNLIEVYWQRNWSVKKLSEELEVVSLGSEKWLFNPVSQLYYSLRNEKDRFSTLNQGTGVFCFDSWIREFRKKRSQLTGQFHDEIIACLKEGQEERYEQLLHKSIGNVNNKLKLNVTLGVDVQFGKTYAEIH